MQIVDSLALNIVLGRYPRYTLDRILGQGSFGVVARVRDDRIGGSTVALKVVTTPDPGRIEHLKREFRRLRGLSHPHIIEFFELVIDDDVAFFTMREIKGQNFLETMQEVPPGPERVARLEELLARRGHGWSHRTPASLSCPRPPGGWSRSPVPRRSPDARASRHG
jgi:hypothetical protein